LIRAWPLAVSCSALLGSMSQSVLML
jgi:hypothetical protein